MAVKTRKPTSFKLASSQSRPRQIRNKLCYALPLSPCSFLHAHQYTLPVARCPKSRTAASALQKSVGSASGPKESGSISAAPSATSVWLAVALMIPRTACTVPIVPPAVPTKMITGPTTLLQNDIGSVERAHTGPLMLRSQIKHVRIK